MAKAVMVEVKEGMEAVDTIRVVDTAVEVVTPVVAVGMEVVAAAATDDRLVLFTTLRTQWIGACLFLNSVGQSRFDFEVGTWVCSVVYCVSCDFRTKSV